MTANTVLVSVIVASHNAKETIAKCLAAIREQQEGQNVEILVVDNSTDGTTEILRQRFPNVNLIVERPSALIPELWATGIRQSVGQVVAITTAHCIPDEGWLAAILRAHESPVAAVGGAIESDPEVGIVDWAIYFCRYSPYMLPFHEREAVDLAGDNASYKRVHLDNVELSWRNGFWEPAVHAELRNAGLQLLLTPAIVIRHKRSFSVWGFIVQRFHHGIQFGRERAARFKTPMRIVYFLLSPIIPVLYVARIARQVILKRGLWDKFLLAFPAMSVFLIAWTLGEAIGYLCRQSVHTKPELFERPTPERIGENPVDHAETP